MSYPVVDIPVKSWNHGVKKRRDLTNSLRQLRIGTVSREHVMCITDQGADGLIHFYEGIHQFRFE